MRALIVLDLRQIIREHLKSLVERELEGLELGGMLEAEVAFDPTFALAPIVASGREVRVSKEVENSWQLQVGNPLVHAVADYTDLAPPEPLHRLLEATARLEAGGVCVVRLQRDPAPAKSHLDARGLSWQVAGRPDGSVLLWVRR